MNPIEQVNALHSIRSAVNLLGGNPPLNFFDNPQMTFLEFFLASARTVFVTANNNLS